MTATKQKKKRYWPKTRKFNGKEFRLVSVNKNKTQAQKRAKRSNVAGVQHRVVSGKTIRWFPKEKGRNPATAKKGKGAVYGRMKTGPLHLTAKGKTYR